MLEYRQVPIGKAKKQSLLPCRSPWDTYLTRTGGKRGFYNETILEWKMRMLSLLLSLALAVGLIQANAVTASAAGPFSFRYAYDCQSWNQRWYLAIDVERKLYWKSCQLSWGIHHVSGDY